MAAQTRYSTLFRVSVRRRRALISREIFKVDSIPDVPGLASAERDRAKRGHAAGVSERHAVERVHDHAAVLCAQGRS